MPMSARFILWFPLTALALAALAFVVPAIFRPLGPLIVPLLGVVMLGMGMTLTQERFLDVLRRPGVVALGVALQFLIMPLTAWALAALLALPAPLAAGLVLVGACPGGTASNVICYIARGDVALSVTLTTLSTLASVVATPLLTWVYVGHRVPVPLAPMLASVAAIVVLPVSLGVVLRRVAGARLAPALRWFPVLSATAVALIIAIIVALNHERLGAIAATAAAAVMLHNLLGLALGYGLARAVGCGPQTCRTLAIEVGMQNSGLGVALAVQHFPAAAAVPGALFSVWHNLSGAALAAWWGRAPVSAGRDAR